MGGAFGGRGDARVTIEAVMDDKASKAMERLASKTTALGSKMMSLGSRIRSAGQSMTIGLTAPIVGLGVAISRAFMGFDDQMAQISALSNAAADDVARWREEILELAPKVAKSPKELADAMFFLASAGLKAGTEMSILELAAQASATGLGETKVIAQALSNVIAAYGQENIDAAQAVGVLIAGVKQGNLETDEMTEVLGRMLPLAQELGITFPELTAALSALSLINADASENASAFLGIIRATVIASPAGEKALRDVGSSYAAVRQAIAEDGLITALQDLRDRFGDNIEAIGAVFPRVRGLTGLLNLTGASAENVDRIFREVASATGDDLVEAFEKVQTPGFQFRASMADLQAGLIELGANVVPMIVTGFQRVAGAVRSAADVFQNLPPAVQRVVVVTAALLAAIGPLAIGLGALITAFGFLLMTLPAVGGAITVLLGPWGLLILAAGAAVVALGTFTNLFDGLPRLARQVGDALRYLTGAVEENSEVWVRGRLAILKFQEGILDAALDLMTLFTRDLPWGIGVAIDKMLDWGSKTKENLNDVQAEIAELQGQLDRMDASKAINEFARLGDRLMFTVKAAVIMGGALQALSDRGLSAAQIAGRLSVIARQLRDAWEGISGEVWEGVRTIPEPDEREYTSMYKEAGEKAAKAFELAFLDRPAVGFDELVRIMRYIEALDFMTIGDQLRYVQAMTDNAAASFDNAMLAAARLAGVGVEELEVRFGLRDELQELNAVVRILATELGLTDIEVLRLLPNLNRMADAEEGVARATYRATETLADQLSTVQDGIGLFTELAQVNRDQVLDVLEELGIVTVPTLGDAVNAMAQELGLSISQAVELAIALDAVTMSAEDMNQGITDAAYGLGSLFGASRDQVLEVAAGIPSIGAAFDEITRNQAAAFIQILWDMGVPLFDILDYITQITERASETNDELREMERILSGLGRFSPETAIEILEGIGFRPGTPTYGYPEPPDIDHDSRRGLAAGIPAGGVTQYLTTNVTISSDSPAKVAHEMEMLAMEQARQFAAEAP